jgi:hypothetical protein
MSIEPPQVVLRYGSHAEKDYFLKLAGQYDGIMFGANLLEITPTATASLLAVLRNNHTSLQFYLDPMTYCFGPYIDPSTTKKRTDLDALKSTRTDRKTKKKFTSVKDSYTSLAAALGPRFGTAVNDGKSCTAIEPSAIPEADRDDFCRGVLNYQLQRIAQFIEAEIPEDEVTLKQEFEQIGPPAALFAPYFYVHEQWADDGFAIAMDLASRSVKLQADAPVHAVVCANDALLSDADHVDYLIDELPKTNVAGAWLWFDGFDELNASVDKLQAFRRIILGLGQEMSVYNLHGGYFSMLLAHDGLTGISHGVGYGERSDVAKVIGVAAPTVRYYLPPIRKRVGVPDIQRCFPDVGITIPPDFFKKVCDCSICKGVIGSDLSRFAAFGQMHRAKPDSKRDTQTPAAAKMCRFHFLLNRLKERGVIAALAEGDRADHVRSTAAPWRNCYPLRSDFAIQGETGYIERWANALDADLE